MDKFVKELKEKLNQKARGNTSDETVLLKAFKYFDLDNSGVCSKEEFLRTMMKIGITSFSEEEIMSMFDSFDEDGSGALNYKEFANILFTNAKPQKAAAEGGMTKKEYISQPNVDNLLKTIRNKLSSRGIQGICSLAKNFRIVDDNNSQTINIDEFKKCCKDFNFGINENQMETVFKAFDRDNSGEIDYDEFLRGIRGEMNDTRKKLVQKAFNILDVNGSGEITFDELQSKYQTNQHPDVKSGRKTEKEVLQLFMNTFQDTYNYLCGTENDDIITLEEFLEYYENVSMSIDNDAYFELLINNAWGMGENTTYNNKKKAWVNKEQNNEENLAKKYQEKFGTKKTEEPVGDPIDQFRKEVMRRGGVGGLISLARQFKIFDDSGNGLLEYDEFTKALKENNLNLTKEQIEELFGLFDKDGSGNIDYNEFLREVRGPMNEKRKEIVKQAFNKLDIDKSGFIDLHEIKNLYSAKNHKDVKSGKKTEEEVFQEFMDTFTNHHYIKSGVKNKKVSFDEFAEYYNYISSNIDNDDYFVLMMQNAWKLNQGSKKAAGKSTKSYAEAGRNRDFNKKSAPFGTDEEEKKPEPAIDMNLPLIEKFRTILKRRGTRGIMSAKREFMIADDNNSKTIDLKEFKKFCHDYRVPIDEKEKEDLFKQFDRDHSGSIDYDEFLRGIMGQMNERRKKIVTQVFKIFDKNGNGLVELDDIRDTYNAKYHPDVKKGKRTEDEVLAEFLDTFEYQFSLLNDGSTKDGKITLDEFIEYYNNISMSIDSDEYFEEMMKSAYNLDNRRTFKKAWRGDI